MMDSTVKRLIKINEAQERITTNLPTTKRIKITQLTLIKQNEVAVPSKRGELNFARKIAHTT